MKALIFSVLPCWRPHSAIRCAAEGSVVTARDFILSSNFCSVSREAMVESDCKRILSCFVWQCHSSSRIVCPAIPVVIFYRSNSDLNRVACHWTGVGLGRIAWGLAIPVPTCWWATWVCRLREFITRSQLGMFARVSKTHAGAVHFCWGGRTIVTWFAWFHLLKGNMDKNHIDNPV
jgi:hypothetical protein